MKFIREKVVLALIHYGYFGAKMPSMHGSYEMSVPKGLQKMIAK